MARAMLLPLLMLACIVAQLTGCHSCRPMVVRPGFSGSSSLAKMGSEVDIGTFAARTASSGTQAVIWRPEGAPFVEIWAFASLDNSGGYMRPNPDTQVDVVISKLSDGEYSKPDKPSDMTKFKSRAAALLDVSSESLVVYRYDEITSPPPESKNNDGRGGLKAGFYRVFQTNHPSTGCRSVPMAWAWHGADSSDYEVWFLAQDEAGCSFLRPGAAWNGTPYSPSSLHFVSVPDVVIASPDLIPVWIVQNESGSPGVIAPHAYKVTKLP